MEVIEEHRGWWHDVQDEQADCHSDEILDNEQMSINMVLQQEEIKNEVQTEEVNYGQQIWWQ